MRKLWYAGAAVASGLILFAASPARADDQPSAPQLRPGNSVTPPFDDLPLLGGLLPSGQRQPSFDDSSSLDRPIVGDTESLPVSGGLLPDPGTPSAPATPSLPDLSGLPAGGMAVLAPAVTGHHKTKPAAAPSSPAVAASTPADSSAPADPRLNEEPIDPAERTFSPDTRPVAGVDQQYK